MSYNTSMFDSQKIRADFPILKRQVHGKPLVYLDNAATSQKPEVVIEAIADYYRHTNANVHRGVHTLSDESTQAWEKSRHTISEFFGAKPAELIITRNTTEALNGVAYGWADQHMRPGDVILSSVLEHHSNLVTWQQMVFRTGAQLELVNVTSDGQLDEDDLINKVARSNVKAVTIPHVSNTLGSYVNLEWLVPKLRVLNPELAIIVDGAQSASHLPIKFDQLGIDFYAFSGHKMLGPMGIGGLLVREQLLETHQMTPWIFGGGMIAEVASNSAQFHPDPEERFTAGTPDVADAVGLAAACEYLTNLGMQQVTTHDQDLVNYAFQKLSELPAVELIGPLPSKPSKTAALTSTAQSSAQSKQEIIRVGSVAFIYRGVHAHDVAQVLDSQGVAVRSGHHCTMPLHQARHWQASVRASFHVYSTLADIDRLVTSLAEVKKVFQK